MCVCVYTLFVFYVQINTEMDNVNKWEFIGLLLPWDFNTSQHSHTHGIKKNWYESFRSIRWMCVCTNKRCDNDI